MTAGMPAPDTDDRPAFEGHQPRECGEHRTVGPHRAWCYECSEWCYPEIPCVRCERPVLVAQLGAWERVDADRTIADLSERLSSAYAERDRLKAQVDAVLVRHGVRPSPHGLAVPSGVWCDTCGCEWPCPTAVALGAEPAPTPACDRVGMHFCAPRGEVRNHNRANDLPGSDVISLTSPHPDLAPASQDGAT